jgi:hypothetical protein
MKIEFKNSARNTRGGFAHDTQMFIDDQLEQTAYFKSSKRIIN